MTSPATSTVYQAFQTKVANLKAESSTAITLHMFGDMMLDRNVAKKMSTSGLGYVFKNLAGPDKGLYPGPDFIVANLEGAFAPMRIKTTKSIAFRFDPALAAQLKKYGFTTVSLANNHNVDMGWANVDFTKKTLSAAGVQYFGDGLREGAQFTLISESVGPSGERVAFIGLNNTDHALKMDSVRAAIKTARLQANYVIVMPHWGVEYKRLSRQPERDLARQLIDLGATAVIGAHPHVVQEMELYKGKPIFYSLGNFIFDQYFSRDTQEGLSLGLVLEFGAVKSVYALPYSLPQSQPRLMSGPDQEKFYEWLNKNSRLGDTKFISGVLEI